MTPEEAASAPAHEAPLLKVFESTLDRMICYTRALRVRRAALEYPLGHPERNSKINPIVLQWEAKHDGPTEQSTARVLDRGIL